jgi:hypothetical protein
MFSTLCINYLSRHKKREAKELKFWQLVKCEPECLFGVESAGQTNEMI